MNSVTTRWDFTDPVTPLQAENDASFSIVPLRRDQTPVVELDGMVLSSYNDLLYLDYRSIQVSGGNFTCELRVREDAGNPPTHDIHYFTIGYAQRPRTTCITVGRPANSQYPTLYRLTQKTRVQETQILPLLPSANMLDGAFHTMHLVYDLFEAKLRLFVGDADGQEMNLVCQCEDRDALSVAIQSRKLFLGTTNTTVDPTWGGYVDLCKMTLSHLRFDSMIPLLPVTTPQVFPQSIQVQQGTDQGAFALDVSGSAVYYLSEFDMYAGIFETAPTALQYTEGKFTAQGLLHLETIFQGVDETHYLTKLGNAAESIHTIEGTLSHSMLSITDASTSSIENNKSYYVAIYAVDASGNASARLYASPTTPTAYVRT